MDGGESWYDEIVGLGLTGYEARAYLSLIGRDRSTAAQIARDSGVPRQRIYDVLGALTQRGLVRPIHGQVTRYTAVDPAAAIERLMANHRAAFSRLEQTTTGLIEALVPLWSRGRAETDPLDFVEVIRDEDVLVDRYQELQTQAAGEILSMAKLPYVVSDNPAGIDNARRVKDAGGRVRCVYEWGVLGDPDLAAEMYEYTAVGEEARLTERLPMRMFIVDGARVLMSLRDPVADATSMTNVLIEHPALAQCLTYAFETIWTAAAPLEELRSAPGLASS